MIGTTCRCGGVVLNGCCTRCGPRQRKHHRTTAERGYHGGWDGLSARYRMNNPLCEICEQEGRVTPATEVHHRVPIDKDRTLRMDVGNLVAVCRACHEKLEGKTAPGG